MDKKAGGEAEPEAMRLHIINSCLFALDPSPFCTSSRVIWCRFAAHARPSSPAAPTTDDDDRRVCFPAMAPLHAQMRELGCEGAFPQRSAKRRRRSPR